MQDERHTIWEQEDRTGHISMEESENLYGAPAFAGENPQYKSWIIYSLFLFGACV